MSPKHRNFLIIFLLSQTTRFCTPSLSDDELATVALYYNSPFITFEQIVAPNVSLLNFAPDLPTKLIIHGYIANRFHGSIEPVKNAYLGRGDVNVLVVDWAQLSHKLYDESRSYIRQIGNRIGTLLSHYVKNHNVNLNDIHVIGHSLGAHIAGNVGRYFDGQLGRITGLDPAAPLFTNVSNDAIRQSDGQFVDIIHTCAYALGEIWARGHVDFYPNSGRFHQPGCRKDDLLQLFSCSHFRSSLFYAESILFPYSFSAVKCSLREITGDGPNKCINSNESVYMGDVTPTEYDMRTIFGKTFFLKLDFPNITFSEEMFSQERSRGLYYLTTNEMYPFGRGNYTQYGIL